MKAGWKEYKEIKEILIELLNKGYTVAMIKTVTEQIEVEQESEKKE